MVLVDLLDRQFGDHLGHLVHLDLEVRLLRVFQVLLVVLVGQEGSGLAEYICNVLEFRSVVCS